MRVAVVFFAGAKKEKLVNVARGLVKGIESQGHQVDIIDGEKDINTKLTIYGYIVVGTSALSVFSGKINERISRYIGDSGIVSGKRSSAFVLKSGFRTSKVLSTLMKTMEHEGMYLKYSEILNSPEEAEAIGKRLHCE